MFCTYIGVSVMLFVVSLSCNVLLVLDVLFDVLNQVEEFLFKILNLTGHIL